MSVEQAKEKFLEETGIDRYGRPEEIADLMAYLVSPAAHWMRGGASNRYEFNAPKRHQPKGDQ